MKKWRQKKNGEGNITISCHLEWYGGRCSPWNELKQVGGEFHQHYNGSVDSCLHPEGDNVWPDVLERMGQAFMEKGSGHPLQGAVQAEVHHGASQAIAGEGEGKQFRHNIAATTAGGRLPKENDNGVNSEKRKACKVVEAEQGNVGCGRRAECKGQQVHPGGHGSTVRDEEEEHSGQDLWTGVKLVLEGHVEEDDHEDEEEVCGEVPGKAGQPVHSPIHATHQLQVEALARALLNQEEDKASCDESQVEYGSQRVNEKGCMLCNNVKYLIHFRVLEWMRIRPHT